jgi:hypothetical protein
LADAKTLKRTARKLCEGTSSSSSLSEAAANGIGCHATGGGGAKDVTDSRRMFSCSDSGSSGRGSPVALRLPSAMVREGRVKQTCRKVCHAGSDDEEDIANDSSSSSSSKSSYESFSKPQRLSDLNADGGRRKATAKPKKVVLVAVEAVAADATADAAAGVAHNAYFLLQIATRNLSDDEPPGTSAIPRTALFSNANIFLLYFDLFCFYPNMALFVLKFSTFAKNISACSHCFQFHHCSFLFHNECPTNAFPRPPFPLPPHRYSPPSLLPSQNPQI